MNRMKVFRTARNWQRKAELEVREAEEAHNQEGTDETALLLTMAREELDKANENMKVTNKKIEEHDKTIDYFEMVTFS